MANKKEAERIARLREHEMKEVLQDEWAGALVHRLHGVEEEYWRERMIACGWEGGALVRRGGQTWATPSSLWLFAV